MAVGQVGFKDQKKVRIFRALWWLFIRLIVFSGEKGSCGRAREPDREPAQQDTC